MSFDGKHLTPENLTPENLEKFKVKWTKAHVGYSQAHLLPIILNPIGPFQLSFDFEELNEKRD